MSENRRMLHSLYLKGVTTRQVVPYYLTDLHLQCSLLTTQKPGKRVLNCTAGDKSGWGPGNEAIQKLVHLYVGIFFLQKYLTPLYLLPTYS